MVVLDDEYDADEIIQDFRSCIGMDAVNQIVENLDEQSKDSTLDDYIEAINYYIENDAFIDKENPYNKPQGGYKIWGMAGTSDKTDI